MGGLSVHLNVYNTKLQDLVLTKIGIIKAFLDIFVIIISLFFLSEELATNKYSLNLTRFYCDNLLFLLNLY